MSSKRILFTAILSMLVAACGGGGGSSAGPVASAKTGTVSIAMADGPIDGYSKIIMVIDQIRLLSDAGQDVIVLDSPKAVDFLALSNFSEVLIKREVVAGSYSKIRLILNSLTLVKTDAAGNVVQTDNVQLNGLQKIDINPQGSFQVRGGEEIIINVDLDLKRSIHIVKTGNGKVIFRPVVFAKISTQPAFDELFRIEGTIDSINNAAVTMNVCDIRRVSDDGVRSPNPKEVCVFTDPSAATSYFDAESVPLAAGFDGLAVNDSVVMYGKFDPAAAKDTFVPAVIATGSRDTFNRERGISSNFAPDPNNVNAPGTMNLDEVSNVCLQVPVHREVSVAAETAVFSEEADGKEMRILRTQITRCRATEVEGFVVNPGAASEFLRSFVVLQGAPIGEEDVVGSLATTATQGKYTLTPTPPASGDQCVLVVSSTVITQIQTVGATAIVTHPATVPLGVEVDVIGTRDSGNCLVATELIREI